MKRNEKGEGNKRIRGLYRQYIETARSLEYPHEREWVYGKVDGITEAIDIVQLIDEQEREGE